MGPSMTQVLFLSEVNKMEHLYLLHVFLTVMVVDIFLGTVKGFLTKKMDSSIGSKGLIKHLTMISITLIAFFFADIGGFGQIATAFVVMGIIQYGNSCIENWCEMGFPFPRAWRQYLNKLTDKDGNVIDFPNVLKNKGDKQK